MQTFVPYANIKMCAECLDDKRLYKQIVECKQILNTLKAKRDRQRYPNSEAVKIAWENHPAVLMWEGHDDALRNYQVACLEEWLRRRYGVVSELKDDTVIAKYPEWYGDEAVHRSHRLNLLFKDSTHYSKFFDEVVPVEKPEYVWPVRKVKG